MKIIFTKFWSYSKFYLRYQLLTVRPYPSRAFACTNWSFSLRATAPNATNDAKVSWSLLLYCLLILYIIIPSVVLVFDLTLGYPTHHWPSSIWDKSLKKMAQCRGQSVSFLGPSKISKWFLLIQILWSQSF